MLMLAAFVAMLGKQWLSRYLRHTGGSMASRSGRSGCSSSAPNRPLPPHLRPVTIHVVGQHLRRARRLLHRPQLLLIHRDHGRWDILV